MPDHIQPNRALELRRDIGVCRAYEGHDLQPIQRFAIRAAYQLARAELAQVCVHPYLLFDRDHAPNGPDFACVTCEREFPRSHQLTQSTWVRDLAVERARQGAPADAGFKVLLARYAPLPDFAAVEAEYMRGISTEERDRDKDGGKR